MVISITWEPPNSLGSVLWHRYISIPQMPHISLTPTSICGSTQNPIIVPHYEELYDGETIRLKANSGFYLKVIHTPGHTPGSVTFYAPEENVAFVGDTLYQHGPGLTNFPGGNIGELKDSILNKILTLPPDTLLLSGHSSPITVDREKQLLLH